MQIFKEINGRWGNAVFRHLAATLISILYDGKTTYNIHNTTHILSEPTFEKWMKHVLDTGGDTTTRDELFNALLPVSANDYYKVQEHKSTVIFGTNIDPLTQLTNNDINGVILNGYFQYDAIYTMFKSQIIEWIKTHPDERIASDDKFQCRAVDLITHLTHTTPQCDAVVHIRLKDFMTVGWVIHPNDLAKVLNTIQQRAKKRCKFLFVMETPKTALEKRYLQYFTNKYDITLQSGTILEDYYTIRNASTIVCSLSTLCWAAAFFSTTVSKVYFPYNTNSTELPYSNPHHFKQPIANTEHFTYKGCTKKDIERAFGTQQSRNKLPLVFV